MRRRDLLPLLIGLGGAYGPPAAAQPQKVPVVGFLAPHTPERLATILAAGRKAMGEAGFVEGRTVAVEYRFAGSDHSRLPALAADLVARRVDVIWAGPLVAALAAKSATANLPIVFSHVLDPVGQGLVKRLNQPEGNITGVCFAFEEMEAKRLQLLHEAVPAARRIGYLIAEKDTAYRRGELERVEAAAKSLGVEVVLLTATKPEEIEPALAAGKRLGVGAVSVQQHAFFFAETTRLVQLLARYALPASRIGDFAAQGGLLSYSAEEDDIAYKAGTYVALILKGAKPAELPVLQPTKFNLVINLKTAKALGLTVPPTLLTRADEVIE